MQECSPAMLLMADPSTNDLCVRWKMEVLRTSCLHPGLGLRKVWDEQLVICVPAETETQSLNKRGVCCSPAGLEMMLLENPGDLQTADTVPWCGGHVTRDTCDGCWPGLAASKQVWSPDTDTKSLTPPPAAQLRAASRISAFHIRPAVATKISTWQKNIRLSVEQYCQTCTDQYFCNFLFKLWICFHPAASSIQQL